MYCIAYGSCIACHVPIAFNPHFVPSLHVDGSKEPLCRVCHVRWNEIHRIANGLEPIPVHPAAYEHTEDQLDH